MKKKWISIMVAAVLAVSALTGCGSGGSETEEAQKQETTAAGEASKESSGDSSKDEGAVLRIGAQPYPLYSSVYVAYELGYLKEEFDV